VGRMRIPTNWTYTSVPQPVLIDRGFTGHACPPKLSRRLEHYDNFGLIDMNGRMGVYPAASGNPILGRFLGVDPIIQDAGNSQSINGFGYCMNNPLRYTDPSGFTYKAYMNPVYGDGNYWYRGQPPGTWSDWESFHHIGSGGTGNYPPGIITASDINSLCSSTYGGNWSASVMSIMN